MNLRTILAVPILALSIAGPAMAQDPTGFWHTPAGDSLSIKVQTSIDPLTQIARPRGLLQLRYANGSWAVCVDNMSGGSQGGGNLRLVCNLSTFRDGQVLNGPWKQPQGRSAGELTVDFYTKQIVGPGIAQAIERTVLSGGGLNLPSIANAPFNTVYVKVLRHPDNTVSAPQLGNGFFIEAQGGAVRMDVNTFNAAGDPIGLTLAGQCQMNGNFVCFVTGNLLMTSGASLGSMSLILTMNGMPHLLYPGESFQPTPPTDPENRLAVYAWQ